MKLALMVIALLLLGSGGAVLISESRALSRLEDKRVGFANGSGFVAERDARELMDALVSNAQLQEIIKVRLAERPFDPVLLGLKAEILVEQDLLASAKILDQAVAIAPRDPRVEALRGGLQARLQNTPSPASPSVE